VTGQSPRVSQYQLKRFKYNSHYWILRFWAEEKRPLRILEVGTADGYLGAIFERAGPLRC
jgi:predicted O-methyltransferase YrrM